MKRYIIGLIIIFATSALAHSQTADGYAPPTPAGDAYEYMGTKTSIEAFNYKNTPEWGKYKTLRAVGWTSFGVGFASLNAGIWTYLFESSLSGKTSAAGPILTITGSVLTAASIPLLISAYHYRSKAKKAALNIGLSQICTPTPAMANRIDYAPALSLSINF